MQNAIKTTCGKHLHGVRSYQLLSHVVALFLAVVACFPLKSSCKIDLFAVRRSRRIDYVHVVSEKQLHRWHGPRCNINSDGKLGGIFRTAA